MRTIQKLMTMVVMFCALMLGAQPVMAQAVVDLSKTHFVGKVQQGGPIGTAWGACVAHLGLAKATPRCYLNMRNLDGTAVVDPSRISEGMYWFAYTKPYLKQVSVEQTALAARLNTVPIETNTRVTMESNALTAGIDETKMGVKKGGLPSTQSAETADEFINEFEKPQTAQTPSEESDYRIGTPDRLYAGAPVTFPAVNQEEINREREVVNGKEVTSKWFMYGVFGLLVIAVVIVCGDMIMSVSAPSPEAEYFNTKAARALRKPAPAKKEHRKPKGFEARPVKIRPDRFARKKQQPNVKPGPLFFAQKPSAAVPSKESLEESRAPWNPDVDVDTVSALSETHEATQSNTKEMEVETPPPLEVDEARPGFCVITMVAVAQYQETEQDRTFKLLFHTDGPQRNLWEEPTSNQKKLYVPFMAMTRVLTTPEVERDLGLQFKKNVFYLLDKREVFRFWNGTKWTPGFPSNELLGEKMMSSAQVFQFPPEPNGRRVEA